MVQVLGDPQQNCNNLQKRAARIILKVDYITPSVEMFERPRWMTISQRINYNKAFMTYNALNNLTIAYISDLLDTDSYSVFDFFYLFDLILYVPSTIFQLCRDGSSWVEPVLS